MARRQLDPFTAGVQAYNRVAALNRLVHTPDAQLSLQISLTRLKQHVEGLRPYMDKLNEHPAALTPVVRRLCVVCTPAMRACSGNTCLLAMSFVRVLIQVFVTHTERFLDILVPPLLSMASHRVNEGSELVLKQAADATLTTMVLCLSPTPVVKDFLYRCANTQYVMRDTVAAHLDECITFSQLKGRNLPLDTACSAIKGCMWLLSDRASCPRARLHAQRALLSLRSTAPGALAEVEMSVLLTGVHFTEAQDAAASQELADAVEMALGHEMARHYRSFQRKGRKLRLLARTSTLEGADTGSPTILAGGVSGQSSELIAEVAPSDSDSGTLGITRCESPNPTVPIQPVEFEQRLATHAVTTETPSVIQPSSASDDDRAEPTYYACAAGKTCTLGDCPAPANTHHKTELLMLTLRSAAAAACDDNAPTASSMHSSSEPTKSAVQASMLAASAHEQVAVSSSPAAEVLAIPSLPTEKEAAATGIQGQNVHVREVLFLESACGQSLEGKLKDSVAIQTALGAQGAVIRDEVISAPPKTGLGTGSETQRYMAFSELEGWFATGALPSELGPAPLEAGVQDDGGVTEEPEAGTDSSEDSGVLHVFPSVPSPEHDREDDAAAVATDEPALPQVQASGAAAAAAVGSDAPPAMQADPMDDPLAIDTFAAHVEESNVHTIETHSMKVVTQHEVPASSAPVALQTPDCQVAGKASRRTCSITGVVKDLVGMVGICAQRTKGNGAMQTGQTHSVR